MAAQERDVLTVRQAAEYLAVSRTQVYRLLDQGLPSVHLGGRHVFLRSSLMEWMERRERTAVRR